MFESEKSVRALLQACSQDLLSPDGLSEYYFKMSSRRMRCKEVSRPISSASLCLRRHFHLSGSLLDLACSRNGWLLCVLQADILDLLLKPQLLPSTALAG